MPRKKNFLEADGNILEHNLRFVRSGMEEELNQYFGGATSNGAAAGGNVVPPLRDHKVVQPTPGYCIKTFKVNTDEKYFINVCQTAEIPAPEDISEEELTLILQSDAPSAFRIPMSISDPRITKDKSDNPVDVCDIAINPKFFAKCQKSTLFKDFFLALIAEALSDKYNVQIRIDRAIILNNRKFIGTLVSHRVRNNDVRTVLSSYKDPSDADKKQLIELEKKVGGGGGARKPLVQELDKKTLEEMKMKQKIELVKKLDSSIIKKQIVTAASIEPEYKLRAKMGSDEQVHELQAEFYLPKCITSQELTLDIGEDRIMLESMKGGYIFDKFVNYNLNQERACAIFDKTNKMLQVRIPVHPLQ